MAFLSYFIQTDIPKVILPRFRSLKGRTDGTISTAVKTAEADENPLGNGVEARLARVESFMAAACKAAERASSNGETIPQWILPFMGAEQKAPLKIILPQASTAVGGLEVTPGGAVYSPESQHRICTVHYIKQEDQDKLPDGMEVDNRARPNSEFLLTDARGPLIMISVGPSQSFLDSPTIPVQSHHWAAAMRTPPFTSFAIPAETGESSMLSADAISALMELSFGSDDSIGRNGDVKAMETSCIDYSPRKGTA